MKNYILIIVIFELLISVNLLKAQSSNELTLEDIFINNKYSTKWAKTSSWFDDEFGYIKKEKSEKYDEAYDLKCTNPETGEVKIIIPADKLIPEGEDKPINFRRYWFSKNNKCVLFMSNDKTNEASYWILNIKEGKPIKLDFGDFKNNIYGLVLSPDGEKVAFYHQNNIYIKHIKTLKIIQLTVDGSKQIINGNSTAQFDGALNTRGIRWSPDSKKIAFIQINLDGVKEFHMINNTDSLYPRIINFQHIKPGDIIPKAKIGVINLETNKITWMKVPNFDKGYYITNFDWANKTEEIFIQQFNRKQNTMNLLLSQASNGACFVVWIEKDKAFLTNEKAIWIENGKSFLWLSERNGWRQLFKISRDGKKTQLITKGSFDIENIQYVDEKGKWVYYIASPENAIYRYLYRVNLKGKNKIEKVTPDKFVGTNTYSISPSGKWAYHTYSNFNSPPVTNLIKLSDHRVLEIIEDNSELIKKIESDIKTKGEFFKVDIGNGTRLDAWQIKPPDFNPNKKYPVIFSVYSMPGAQFARDMWRYNNYFFYNFMAQKGFIVIGIDSRGTPSLYGREWRKIIYKQHGILPSDDIAAAAKKLAKENLYMDAKRFGVYGWSGGGCVSLLLILRYPDIFQTAIPGAYLSDHRLYSAPFTERFMGLPQDDPEAYDKVAAISYAKNLKGNLLLVHGTGDDNVHYQSTEILINELIKYKKRFYVIPYPNRSHSMSEGLNTKFHQYDTYYWFFSTHMLNEQ